MTGELEKDVKMTSRCSSNVRTHCEHSVTKHENTTSTKSRFMVRSPEHLDLSAALSGTLRYRTWGDQDSDDVQRSG
jgi:hypothetical protein